MSMQMRHLRVDVSLDDRPGYCADDLSLILIINGP